MGKEITALFFYFSILVKKKILMKMVDFVNGRITCLYDYTNNTGES